MAREQDESPRSFGHFFGTLDDEQAHATASLELHKLVQAMHNEALARHGSVAGSLTIKLDFKCDETGAVETHYDVKAKEPKRKTSKSIHWIGKDGRLTHENPRQLELGRLREVSAQGAALRNVENDRPAVKEI